MLELDLTDHDDIGMAAMKNERPNQDNQQQTDRKKLDAQKKKAVLGKALRENLKRRKSQARARQDQKPE